MRRYKEPGTCEICFFGWDLYYKEESECKWYEDTDTPKHISRGMKQCTHFLRRDNAIWRFKQNMKNKI